MRHRLTPASSCRFATAVAGFLAVSLALIVLPASAVAQAGADVEVLVTDAEGEPIDGLEVHAVDPSGSCVDEAPRPLPLVDRCTTATASTDADGRVVLSPPGEFDPAIHVHDPSGRFAPAWAGGEPVAVDRGETVEIEVEEAAEASGRVRDAEGAPVEGTVLIRHTTFAIAETATATDGGFDLRGLRDSSTSIEFVPDDVALEKVRVDVEPGDALDLVVDFHRPDVERLAGNERVATAIAASAATFESADEVVITSASLPFDALAAAPLAAQLGGPLLLVGPRVGTNLAEELSRLGAERVLLVGAVGALPLAVEADIEALGLEVERIAGEERTDTAALVARSVGAPDGEAIVVSAGGFADALAVAPLAASFGIPIVLTATDALSPDAAAALAALDVDRTLVIGGTAAVSQAVVAELPNPTRISGPERYATAAEVLAEAFDRGLDPTWLTVASGRDWPDALTAGAVAAATGSPLALVDAEEPLAHAGITALLDERFHDIERLRVLGGTAALRDAVVDDLAAGPVRR